MKINRAFLVLLLAIFLWNSGSIAQSITFQKTYNDSTYNGVGVVDITHENGYVFAGNSRQTSIGPQQIYLIKTDNQGQNLWRKSFTFPVGSNATSIYETAEGRLLIVGETSMNFYYCGMISLINTDSNGTVIWAKGLDSAIGTTTKCHETTDGGTIITGFTCNSGPGQSDIILIKTDSSGNPQWANNYGGSLGDYGSEVLETTDGGYIIAGWSETISSSDDILIIKTDSIGNLLWTHTYGTNHHEIAFSIHATRDGGYIVTGQSSFSSGYDTYLLKIDGIGYLDWFKSLNGVDGEVGQSVDETSDGGIVITGHITFDGTNDRNSFLIKTDSLGDVLWSKIFLGSGNNGARSVKQTQDKGFILSGGTLLSGTNISNAYIIKTDSLGNSGCNENSIIFSSFNDTIAIGNPAMSQISASTHTINLFAPTESKTGLAFNCEFIHNESELEKFRLRLYPNPPNPLLTIQTPNIHPSSIEISDAMGRVLAVLYPTSETTVFDTRGLGKGMYFVRVVAKGGQETVRLFVE